MKELIFTKYFKLKSYKKLFLISISVVFILAFLIQNHSRFSLSTLAQPIDAKVDKVTLPIIMYHSIMKSKKSLGKFVISQDEFESDLKYLKNNGYSTIVMRDLLDYVYENKSLPEKPIMLTFDDGYYNNYLYAYPLLKTYNCKMILSPIGVEVDRYSELNEHSPYYSHVTWENLKEMQESGLVEIQNHSYDMHKINKKRRGTKKNRDESFEKYRAELSKDLSLMQQKLKSNLNYEATTFVYPFGAMSKCSTGIIKELGFKASFGCEGRVNSIDKNPENLYCLCRIIRPSGISSEKFFSSAFPSK